MRAIRKCVVTAALTVAVANCASTPPPVPIGGAGETLAGLAGEWRGSYDGRDSGRAGSILFRIAAAADSAWGDVVMVPRPDVPVAAPERPGALPAAPPEPEVLRIAFVEAAGGTVRGELGAYRDPQCGCRVTTVFEGVVRGDTISGTFSTLHLDTGLVQRGTWRVVRH